MASTALKAATLVPTGDGPMELQSDDVFVTRPPLTISRASAGVDIRRKKNSSSGRLTLRGQY